jgi:hypothetical protein
MNVLFSNRIRERESRGLGILQPLSIPSQRWEEVSMDFITGLPKYGVMNVIVVVVDRLTKYAHFVSLSHHFKDITLANVDVLVALGGINLHV